MKKAFEYEIVLIAAITPSGIIGNNGKLVFNNRRDKEILNNYIKDCPVIIGRKTWESLPKNAMKDSYKIVMSNDSSWEFCSYDTIIVHSMFDAISTAERVLGEKKIVCVVGGSQIYNEILDYGVVDHAMISLTEEELPGDCYFHFPPKEGWREIMRITFPKEESDTCGFDLIRYDRLYDDTYG